MQLHVVASPAVVGSSPSVQVVLVGVDRPDLILHVIDTPRPHEPAVYDVLIGPDHPAYLIVGWYGGVRRRPESIGVTAPFGGETHRLRHLIGVGVRCFMRW